MAGQDGVNRQLTQSAQADREVRRTRPGELVKQRFPIDDDITGQQGSRTSLPQADAAG